MREDEVGKMFRPMSRGPGGYGYGAGLSVVVQLLASVGGKLEVMTHTGRGTTFWAYFPLNKERAVAAGDPQTENAAETEPVLGDRGEPINSVVTIRKSEGG